VAVDGNGNLYIADLFKARSLLAAYLKLSERSFVSWYGIAFIYTALGDKDQAFACLEKAFQQHSVRLRDLKVEPFLEGLRGDPRFTRLLSRLRLQSHSGSPF
jgi:hypothetical protein